MQRAHRAGEGTCQRWKGDGDSFQKKPLSTGTATGLAPVRLQCHRMQTHQGSGAAQVVLSARCLAAHQGRAQPAHQLCSSETSLSAARSPTSAHGINGFGEVDLFMLLDSF